MPSEKSLSNLIPMNKRTKEDALRIQKMGGATKSINKRIARKIQHMRQNQEKLTDTKVQSLLDVMQDAEYSAFDMRIRIEGLIVEMDDPKAKAILMRLFMDWHKMHHGLKVNVKSENVNINIDMKMSQEKTDDLLSLLRENRE